MIRLDDGIFTWSVFNAEKQCNFNGFLVRADGQTVAVDPPRPSEDDQAYLRKTGLWPDLILITNRNHLRGRDWFLSQRLAPTAMHEAERGQVDVPIERALVDGETLAGGLSVVHLPGKSPGEVALHWKARRTLIVGDALIAPFGALRLIPPEKLDDPEQLRRSLDRLRALDFDRLLLADGDPILSDAKRRVTGFLDGLKP